MLNEMYNILDLPLDLIREIGYIKELIPTNKYFHSILSKKENIIYDKRLKYFSEGIQYACMQAHRMSWTLVAKLFINNDLDANFANNQLLKCSCLTEDASSVYYILNKINQDDVRTDNYICHKLSIIYGDNETLYYLLCKTNDISYDVLKELLKLCVISGNVLAYKYMFHKYTNEISCYEQLMLACIGGYIGYFEHTYNKLDDCTLRCIINFDCHHTILREDDTKKCIYKCLKYDQPELLEYLLKHHNYFYGREIEDIHRRNSDMILTRGCVNVCCKFNKYMKCNKFIYDNIYDNVLNNKDVWKYEFIKKIEDVEIGNDVYDTCSSEYISNWNWNNRLLGDYDFDEEFLEERMLYYKLKWMYEDKYN
ncbi:Ankyrin-repeat protein [Orpheovirus IHUMI-LCC2]|uniref:Ankyrin-repeat protein n=1 Tax=Orpheovirus IHUMI-LCC2 TaxID=2023057 RepID=A0A2I2L4Z0_9VIRU|nr:Ankyrin-repeat protein [Orpheovirus IHUMI-LCC2]SNW62594.1 Ankyrin-repeat protein [Orpheovirus IHUMI-LCC2]